jgi:hypothetical protein
MRQDPAMMRKAVLALALWIVAPVALAQEKPAQLRTNEADIVALSHSDALAVDDPLAVFAFVMGRLPARVQVYPTENYYYFRFLHDGVPYDGNIRLAAADRDRGVVHFAYSERPADWNKFPPPQYVPLTAKDGVAVEKVEPLVYRVSLSASRGGHSVTFALNDLSQVKPPLGLLTADEKFIGPSFDESGLRFFFVFNTRLKVFHYLLDETLGVADAFAPAAGSDRIVTAPARP